MLRDQISELKLQLIEKNANCDHLRLEIEAKTQAHARAIEQLENNAHKEELKMKSLVTELREVGWV